MIVDMLCLVLFSVLVFVFLIIRSVDDWKDNESPGNVNENSGIGKYAAVDEEGVLNVHIIPHTHDDVGWRKTVEQYFYGYNMSIDTRGFVKEIITSAVESLMQNPQRTFTYVESKYLSMWWSEASSQQQESLRYLIANGQWSFVNGGWSMHDEACTHYMGMVDSTTTGHSFLLRHLGYIPNVAWQLDPFGHSATQANLLTHKMGMDAVFFGRIDYQDLDLRQQTRNCEGLWNPMAHQLDSADVDPTVFWGLTGSYMGNYGPPPGICFDSLCGGPYLVDLGLSERYQKAESYLKSMAKQASQTKYGQDIMLTMGSDFEYSHAESHFGNMDLLINTIMLGQKWELWNISNIFQGQGIRRVNMFYSSPIYYAARKYNFTLRASHDVNHATSDTKGRTVRNRYGQRDPQNHSSSLWSIKTDDFFPYSDCPNCFWTGYFTSRTAFKRFERVASAFLQAARQLDLMSAVLAHSTSDDTVRNAVADAETHTLFSLEDALGVSQHHDSVSGTGKQHVADDYSKRLQSGLDQASAYVADIIQKTVNASFPLQYCSRLNESICETATATRFDLGEQLYVVLYNPLARQRNWAVRIPVSFLGSYTVEQMDDSTSHSMQSSNYRNKQIVAARAVQTRSTSRTYHTDPVVEVEFKAAMLPPLGGVTYRISLQQRESADLRDLKHSPLVSVEDNAVRASNGRGLVVTFDGATGQMQQVSFHKKQDGASVVNVALQEQWGYYIPYDNSLDQSSNGQCSGAYIFRPSIFNQTLQLVGRSGKPQFLPIERGLEVHTAYGEGEWIQQVVRVIDDQPWIEVEYTVGPVPIQEGRGKEVVSRFLATTINNQGVFFTDSNGRAFLKRQRDVRPSWNMTVYEPIAGNYYPVNAAIYIQDESASLTLLTDRSRGGASIVDGSLEVKVQRRTLVDDYRGVEEPINETSGGRTPYPPYGDAVTIGEGVIVRGVHRLMIGSGNQGASLARSAMDDIFAQPLVLFGSSPSTIRSRVTRPSFSVLGATELPPNIFLMTLMRLYDEKSEETFLIRLAHQYGSGEDEVLAKPSEVNVARLFQPKYKVLSITEKTLSGNQNWKDFVMRKYNWTTPTIDRDTEHIHSTLCSGKSNSTTITLQPMDIRTFYVAVEANQ